MPKDKYDKALGSWIDLNAKINNFKLDELHTLMQKEQTGQNRPSYIKRIHQRITRLRSENERKDLMP